MEKELSWLPKRNFDNNAAHSAKILGINEDQNPPLAFIEVDGKEYQIQLYRENRNALIDKFGQDCTRWTGKIFEFRISHVKNKKGLDTMHLITTV